MFAIASFVLIAIPHVCGLRVATGCALSDLWACALLVVRQVVFVVSRMLAVLRSDCKKPLDNKETNADFECPLSQAPDFTLG